MVAVVGWLHTCRAYRNGQCYSQFPTVQSNQFQLYQYWRRHYALSWTYGDPSGMVINPGPIAPVYQYGTAGNYLACFTYSVPNNTGTGSANLLPAKQYPCHWQLILTTNILLIAGK